MISLFKRLVSEDSGQGLVEYALIIALVAVALIVALGTLQGGIEHIFDGIGDKLSSESI